MGETRDAVCEAQAAQCLCGKTEGHVDAGDPVHACPDAGCGGQWTGAEETGDFRVVRFPHADGLGPLFDAFI